MKRKLVKQGNNALTISLPYRWIEKFDLQKGDYINIFEQNKDLLISIDKHTNKKTKKIEISLKKPFFKRYVRSSYVLGYDEVEIFSKEKLPFELIKESIKDLIGYEILQQQNKTCLVGIITENNSENIDLLLKKLFFMLDMMFLDIIEAFSFDNFEDIKDTARVESSVNSFVDFCLRALNKQGYKEYKKTQYIYHILTLLEEIADSLRDFCLNIKEANKEIKDKLIRLKEYYNIIFKLYLDYDMAVILKVKEIRKNLFLDLRKDCHLYPLQYLDMYTVQVLLHQLEVLIDPIKTKI
jgi:phosphate uptake regulator